MRHSYIVTYDIADPKRLRLVFKICKDYGAHLQFSVFECDLNPREKIEMERKLSQTINNAEDQLLFILIGPTETRGERLISALGLPYIKFDSSCYVV